MAAQEKPALKNAGSDFPAFGERGLIIGQTGSGKTNFGAFLLTLLPFGPFIVYDTKQEPNSIFNNLPNSIVVRSPKERDEALEKDEFDFLIFRPPTHVAIDNVEMDNLLLDHFENLPGVGLYIDEIYAFHAGNGRDGPGLRSILTQGRSRGQTCIMSTQRPSWISAFCYSESQKFYIFYLNQGKDKKRVSDFIPDFENQPDPPRHGFLHYQNGGAKELEKYKLFNPVPVLKAPKIPALDNENKNGLEETIPGSTPRLKEPKNPRAIAWIR